MEARSVIAEMRMRSRNQMTMPEPVVEAAVIAAGDRFLVEVTRDDPDTVRLHRIRSSYAGALRDVYGDVTEHVAEERSSWDGPDQP